MPDPRLYNHNSVTDRFISTLRPIRNPARQSVQVNNSITGQGGSNISRSNSITNSIHSAIVGDPRIETLATVSPNSYLERRRSQMDEFPILPSFATSNFNRNLSISRSNSNRSRNGLMSRNNPTERSMESGRGGNNLNTGVQQYTNTQRSNAFTGLTNLNEEEQNTGQGPAFYSSDLRALGDRSSPFTLRQDNFMLVRDGYPLVNSRTLLSPDALRAGAISPTHSSILDQEEEETFAGYSSQDVQGSQNIEGYSDAARSLPGVEPTYTSQMVVNFQKHQSSIAEALGFKKRQRLLKFTPPPKKTKKNLNHSNSESESSSASTDDSEGHNKESDEVNSPTSSFSPNTSIDMEQLNDVHRHSKPTSPPRDKQRLINSKLSRIKKELPHRVVETPALRNNYYSNILAFSKQDNKMVLGIGSDVLVCFANYSVITLQSVPNELISCTSFSDTDIVAVGTKAGRVIVYDTNSVVVSASGIFKTGVAISCICWIPGSSMFFTGDDIGNITLYEISRKDTHGNNNINNPQNMYGSSLSLSIKTSFNSSANQICGMAISADKLQLAVGSNDNACCLWDISNLDNPQRQFSLKHQAAVKAIAYCPWAPYLLATGGGSKDRHVRYWHSKTGTLLSSFRVPGQITALIWSRTKKEILVTFGFNDPEIAAVLLAVYSYPEMELRVRIDSFTKHPTRIISADISSDFSSVGVAVSDKSVKLFEVWDANTDFHIDIDYERGLYGSKLIEMNEGADDMVDLLR